MFERHAHHDCSRVKAHQDETVLSRQVAKAFLLHTCKITTQEHIALVL